MAWPDARGFNERMLRALWSELGGRISGSVREGSAPSTTPSYEWPSPPLADVVRDINKYSNNTMAQQLFLTLGLRFGGAGTPDAARQVILRWLEDRLGPDSTAGMVLDNGSGLSRQTRLSAALVARVLQWAWASPIMPELLSSLPVAGVDGTARKSRAASGLAHLKTGSLRDVAAIAGVVLAESGKRYVVVATVAHRDAAKAKPALDALVQWTAHDRP
jgi:D-alanyl-D-alanine carboxypeptidase/D-alanyl-D-alanine-endopeptidase (penicillin-binding protein 4)